MWSAIECDRVRRSTRSERCCSTSLRRSEQGLKVAVESADLYVYEMDYRRHAS